MGASGSCVSFGRSGRETYREVNKGLYTTWLREFSSCSCLTVLPGPAWVLLSKKYLLFPGAMSIFSQRPTKLATSLIFRNNGEQLQLEKNEKDEEREARQKMMKMNCASFEHLCLSQASVLMQILSYPI